MSSQFPQAITGRPKVLITGGNGFVGSHLAERLSALGIELFLLLRTTSKLDNISELQYTPVIGDLRDGGELIEILPEIEYIFHSAGLVKAASLQNFLEVNAGGTAKLIDLVMQHARRLKRFVYISSQSAAGPCREKRPKCETDEPKPISDYGKSKLEGEKLVQSAAELFPITIVRPSAVFGPRDTEVLSFFRSVKLGLMLKFGRKEKYVSVVYIADLVDGIVRAALSDQAIGQTFFINSQDDISQWEAQAMMSEIMKVDIRPLVVPIPLLRIAGSVLETIDRSLNRVPFFSRDKAIELSQQYWLSSSAKSKAMLEYRPQYSVSEAFAITYRWYCDQGWL